MDHADAIVAVTNGVGSGGMSPGTELLAIVGIAILCLSMFGAWVASMAICPDAMVNIFSGNSDGKYTPSSRDSRELIRKSSSNIDVEAGEAGRGEGGDDSTLVGGDDEVDPEALDSDMVRSVSAVLQFSANRRLSDKKLSVVDEVDEQLTLQSTIHSGGRPSILRHPVVTQVVEVHNEASADASKLDERDEL